MKTKITDTQINNLINRLENIKDTFSEITLRSPQWLKFLSGNKKIADQITGMHEDLGWHMEGISDKESFQKAYHEAIEAFVAGDSELLKEFIKENNLFYYFFMHKFAPKVNAGQQKFVPPYIEILEEADIAFKKFQKEQKPVDKKSLIANLVQNLQIIKHPGSENIQQILLQERAATEVTEEGKNFLEHVGVFALLGHYKSTQPDFFNSLPYQIRHGNSLLLDFLKQMDNGKKEAYMALLTLIQKHLLNIAKDTPDTELFSRNQLKDIDTNFLKKWFSTFPPKTQAYLQKIGYKPLSSGSDIRGNFLLACKGCCNETNVAGFENIAALMQDTDATLTAEGKAFLQSPEVGFILAHYALEHKTSFYTLLPKEIQNAYNPTTLNEEGLFLDPESLEYRLNKYQNPNAIQTPKKGFLALFQSIEETYRLGKPSEALSYHFCSEESLLLFIQKHFSHFPTLIQQEIKEVLVLNPMKRADEICALSPVQGISYSPVFDNSEENISLQSVVFHFKTDAEKQSFMNALGVLAHHDALSGHFADHDDGILLSIPCLNSFSLLTFSQKYLNYFKPHCDRQIVESKAHALLTEIDALNHIFKVDPNLYRKGNDAFNKTLPIHTVQYIFETAEKRDAFVALLQTKAIPFTYAGLTQLKPQKPIVELPVDSVMRLTTKKAMEEAATPLEPAKKAGKEKKEPTQSSAALLVRQAVESKARALLAEIDALDHVFKVDPNLYKKGNDAFNKTLPIHTVQYIFETAEKRDAFAALLQTKAIPATYVGLTRFEPRKPIVELLADSLMHLNIQKLDATSDLQELPEEDVDSPNVSSNEELQPVHKKTLPAKALRLLDKYEEKRKEYTDITLPPKEKIKEKLLNDQKISGIYPADITAIFRKLNQFAHKQKEESVENLKKIKVKALYNLCMKHYEDLCAKQDLNPNADDVKHQDPELALFQELTNILRGEDTVDNKFGNFCTTYNNQKIQFSCLDKFLASIDFLGIFNVTRLIDIDRDIAKISEADYASAQKSF